jgi:hypothetical protein
MKKETAVEWLFFILNDSDKDQKFANEILEQAKVMEKEQLEKELISFFLYFRDNGERLIGASIEQLVKSYLSSKILD